MKQDGDWSLPCAFDRQRTSAWCVDASQLCITYAVIKAARHLLPPLSRRRPPMRGLLAIYRCVCGRYVRRLKRSSCKFLVTSTDPHVITYTAYSADYSSHVHLPQLRNRGAQNVVPGFACADPTLVER